MFKVNLAVLLLLFTAPCNGAIILKHDQANRVDADRGLQFGAPFSTPAPRDPTDVPTDSPAPSPSPSAAPTVSPTGTPQPTKVGSSTPTDTMAPSPSPSAVPTKAPTKSPSAAPTDQPSASPSQRPSNVPSASPSDHPTTSPSTNPTPAPSVSSSPSYSPSVSPAPSVSPSHAPSPLPSASPSKGPTMSPSSSLVPTGTPSISPSAAPSRFSKQVVTHVSMTFHGIVEPIEGEVEEVFNQQTKEFLQVEVGNSLDGYEIEITDVEITEQTFIPDRRLGQGERELHEAGWRTKIKVTGMIYPGNPPPRYSFANAVFKAFTGRYLEYIYRLSSAHPFFNVLLVSSTDPEAVGGEPRQASSDEGVGAGATAGIVIGAFAALALAIWAAVYAVRHRDVVRARSVGSYDKSDAYMLDHCDSHSTAMTPHPKSPNTLERGFDEVTAAASHDSSHSSKNHKSLLDKVISEDAEDESLGERLAIEVQSKHGTKADPPSSGKEVITKTDAPGGLLATLALQTLSSGCFSSDDELSPTAQDNAETPRSLLSKDSFAASSVSSFGDLLNQDSEEGTLGARPMDEPEQTQYKESGSAGGVPSLKRQGLYDVFACAGPLGVVVDTTKDGPVVHSLKPTSALVGLMTPGDLIVGLDDQDTRSMTAATLTRMMAKKSNQPERKITLLAVVEE